MRVLFVVQRYGDQIAGGAEHLVRQYAHRLSDRGHHIEVLTSCSLSYTDWANVYEPGVHHDAAVTVHRLPVARRRDNTRFGRLHGAVVEPQVNSARYSPVVTSAWSRMIGPDLVGLHDWLHRNCTTFDAVVFSGYLYTPSTHGLPAISGLVPTVLQSVAHDEMTLRLPAMRSLFDHAAGFNFLTEEEATLVQQRFRPRGVKATFGAGVETPPSDIASDIRERYGIGDSPYVVCVGRIDPAKGMPELAGYFVEFKKRWDRPLKLVFVGSEVHPLTRHDDVIVTGFVDEPTKWGLLTDAAVLAQPSYFESFSLSLAEGWRCGVPAIVQGRNDVLAGQVRRAQGGLSFVNFAEFDAGLATLLEDRELAQILGRNGRDYVERYNWPTILDRFELVLHDTIDAWHTLTSEGSQPPH